MEIELQRKRADDILSRLLEDPEVKELFLTKLKKLFPNQTSKRRKLSRCLSFLNELVENLNPSRHDIFRYQL